VQLAERLGTTMRNGVVNELALLRAIGRGDETEQLPGEIALVRTIEIDERCVDAVEGCAGHESNNKQAHAFDRFPTTLEMFPPPASRRRRASSASTSSLTMASAVFTCPAALSSSSAARSRSMPSVSMRMR
jgi:hypothetical protein